MFPSQRLEGESPLPAQHLWGWTFLSIQLPLCWIQHPAGDNCLIPQGPNCFDILQEEVSGDPAGLHAQGRKAVREEIPVKSQQVTWKIVSLDMQGIDNSPPLERGAETPLSPSCSLQSVLEEKALAATGLSAGAREGRRTTISIRILRC